MTFKRIFSFLFVGLAALIGCTQSPSTPRPATSKAEPGQAKANQFSPEQETKFKTALAKLSNADRPLAEAQKFCPILKRPLGFMGKPDRIEIDGQAVFLCCSGCTDDARADPKKTLDQIAQFKKGLK